MLEQESDRVNAEITQINARAASVSTELNQVDIIAGRIEQAVTEMTALKISAEEAAGQSEIAAGTAQQEANRAVAAAVRADAAAARAAVSAAKASAPSLFRPPDYNPDHHGPQ